MSLFGQIDRPVIIINIDDQTPPYLLARYDGQEAKLDQSGNVMEGKLPKGAEEKVKEWLNQRRREHKYPYHW